MVPEGLLLVNKPRGVTSHDVVAIVRHRLGVQRVGHAGTLDPLAEGLLIVLVGAATKHQRALQGHEKAYEAVLQLGTQTDTGDAAGKPVRAAPISAFARDDVAQILEALRGPMTQTPPIYSAVKVQGRPAYWWARRQQSVVLAPRVVQVTATTLVACDHDTITFRVTCSAGTYIRTLAEFIAERLGTVGHLVRLVRLRVGCWHVDQAQPLSWVRTASPEALTAALRPCEF